MSTRVEIDSFVDGIDFSETLSRAKFEELNIAAFRKTLKPVEQVLKDGGVKKSDIDDIVFGWWFHQNSKSSRIIRRIL